MKVSECLLGECKCCDPAGSQSEAMRLIAPGSVSVFYVDQQPTIVNDPKTSLELQTGMLLKAGKKKIVRLEIVQG